MQNKRSIVDVAARLEGPFKHRALRHVDGYCAYLVRMEGHYLFHQHPKDEMYMVIEGMIAVEYDDGSSLVLEPKEMLTVEAGVRHRSRSDNGALVVMFKARDLFADWSVIG